MSPSIFHQQDLSSGISRAIQEQKLVACFVRQDNEESELWENEWLCDSTRHLSGRSLGNALDEKAVILRITFGSQEATFLNSFCPVSRSPTLAIIHTGRVLEKIESGIEEDEFVRRVLIAVGLDADVLDRVEETTDEEEVSESPEATTGAVEPNTNHQTPITTSIPAETHVTQTDASSSQVQKTYSERGARLEAERKKREAAEKAERIARMKARQKESYQATNDKGKQPASSTEQQEKEKARDQWIFQQKKRKDEAKHERERILAQIQADKEERRARAQMQKEAQANAGDGAFYELPDSSNATSSSSAVSKAGDTCSLQIRLFDGSSIRGKFPADADLATTVRKWVDSASSAGGADRPYSFRQILAPRPSRSIEVSEEHHSLFDLGLAPSATLVLVPVNNFTEAYSGASSGYVGTALNTAYSVASTGYGMLGSMLAYVPGLGAIVPAQHESPAVAAAAAARNDETSSSDGARAAAAAAASSNQSTSSGAPKSRMKTLADQRAEAAREQNPDFYNGNSLKFEGRKDKDGDDKK